MSRQYNNFKTIIVEANMNILTSEEEYVKSKNEDKIRALIKYQCENGHISEMTCASFVNKTSKTKTDLCAQCNNEPKQDTKFDEWREEILQLTGHELLSYDPKTRAVAYKCQNCKNISKSTIQNLKRNQGVCVACSQKENRKNFEDIIEICNKQGLKCLMKSYEYTNNKQLIPYICVCGKKNEAVLNDIKRGKKCMECKSGKYKNTCLEKYGVENTFQALDIKEKIKESNLQNHGVEYPQQNDEIRKKTEQTCLEKYMTKWAFTQDYVFQKIRKTHLEKYGVEYPLQNKNIQEKIEETFMKNYEAKRPFLSETFQAKFKEQMISKYGYPYPSQCPEIFAKIIKSNFTRKSHVLPKTSRILMVLGYEYRAINRILSTKNPVLDRIIEEDEIEIENTPTFMYVAEDGKQRRYYPDIWIKNTNVLYEVKSAFIFNRMPERNLKKFQATADEGYILIVYFYNAKKLVDIWYFCKNKKPKSMKLKGFMDSPGKIVFDFDKNSIISCEDEQEHYIKDIMIEEIEDTYQSLE